MFETFPLTARGRVSLPKRTRFARYLALIVLAYNASAANPIDEQRVFARTVSLRRRARSFDYAQDDARVGFRFAARQAKKCSKHSHLLRAAGSPCLSAPDLRDTSRLLFLHITIPRPTRLMNNALSLEQFLFAAARDPSTTLRMTRGSVSVLPRGKQRNVRNIPTHCAWQGLPA